jgi:hydrogenase-1 operon protein HyaE
MIATTVAAPETLAPRHPLIERLFAEYGFAEVTIDGFEAFVGQPGHALVFFSEDPVRFRETLDLAVILPELHRAFDGCFRAGVLLPQASKKIHPRFGFRRWPAFVMLRDGQYLGAIDGIRNWDEYVGEIQRLLASEPVRPPAIGVAVRSNETPGGSR